MAYEKTVWTDEVLNSTPAKYAISGDKEGVISESAQIALVTEVTAGTPVNATNMNKIESGIETAQAAADAAIPKSIVTAAGDLIYATAASVLTRLAKGAAKQILRMNASATAPEWVNGVPGIFTAKGDLVVASAADSAARLAVGADYTLLQARSGATNGLEYASTIGCLLTGTGMSNVASGEWSTAINWTKTYDYSTFQSGSGIIIPSGLGGIYIICFSGRWSAASGTTGRTIGIVNGANNLIFDSRISVDSAEQWQNVSIIAKLTAGDTLYGKILQQASTAINFENYFLSVFKLR